MRSFHLDPLQDVARTGLTTDDPAGLLRAVLRQQPAGSRGVYETHCAVDALARVCLHLLERVQVLEAGQRAPKPAKVEPTATLPPVRDRSAWKTREQQSETVEVEEPEVGAPETAADTGADTNADTNKPAKVRAARGCGTRAGSVTSLVLRVLAEDGAWWTATEIADVLRRQGDTRVDGTRACLALADLRRAERVERRPVEGGAANGRMTRAKFEWRATPATVQA